MKPELKSRLSGLKQMRVDRPIAIAHRGASAWANENTLRSFRTAHGLCAEMWELDVHLTKDGICVVCHDDNLMRLTGLDLRISNSVWGDLQEIPLCRGGFLTTFKDVVQICQELDSWLYVEIKGVGAGQAAWEELTKQGFENAVLASFHEDYVLELHNLGCELPLSVLVPVGKDPFVMAESAKADIIHLCWKRANPEPQRLVTPELLLQAEESGLEVVLWDEERPNILADLLQLPVLAICSDKPEMLVPFSKKGNPPLTVVCHRGAETFAPENTLASVDLAFSQGFQIVEIDVHQTLDGVPIVIHDTRVNRTTDSRGRIKEMTYEEAARLDAGSWFDVFYAGEKLPRLGDVLLQAKRRGKVYIEIKKANPDTIIKIVEKTGMLQDTFFWCEDPEVMDRLSILNNEVRLMSRRYDFDSLEAAIERHDPYVIEFEGLKFTQEEITHCNRKGILTMSFSMSSNIRMLKKLARSKLDILNLGHPELLKKMAITSTHMHSF